MAKQGRGSALVFLAVCVTVVFIASEMSEAATFTVGGGGGWTFNVVGWPKGKRFRSGDTLVFNYSPSFHNVVAVDKASYDGCSTPRGARVLTSGQDQLKLGKGMNYFICNIPGHCQSGMKIAVGAA